MREWLLRDLQALTERSFDRAALRKQQHHAPPDIAGIVAAAANRAERCGRLGGAVMHLPASMDSASVVGFLKSCGVTDEDAASDRVVSALVVGRTALASRAAVCRGGISRARSQVRATAPRSPFKDVSHALQLMHELWVAGCRPSSRACASALRLCSPSDAALLLQRMSHLGPRITPHILVVALSALSAPALQRPPSSRNPASPRRFNYPGPQQTQPHSQQHVWLLDSLHPYLHPHASAFASLNIADVQLPRPLPLKACDAHALPSRLLHLLVAAAPASDVARMADSPSLPILASSVLPALVCRLATDNDAARVVDLLTRPRASASCITRSVFNFTVRRLLARNSTAAAANVALLAARYWTMCSARVLRALLLALAAQPSLLHGGSFVASSFSSVADLLRSHVPPLLAAHDPVFEAKNMATTLRCSVMLRDEQSSFKTAADLCSIARAPGAAPALVLHSAKAISCLVGSRSHDSRAAHLLRELCSLPALQQQTAVTACALEILSSHTQPKSVNFPPMEERARRIQAACTLCASKHYPVDLLAAQLHAVWLHGMAHGPHRSCSLRLQVRHAARCCLCLWQAVHVMNAMQRSLEQLKEVVHDDEDAAVAKLERLLDASEGSYHAPGDDGNKLA